jgi:hypothetical protein
LRRLRPIRDLWKTFVSAPGSCVLLADGSSIAFVPSGPGPLDAAHGHIDRMGGSRGRNASGGAGVTQAQRS